MLASRWPASGHLTATVVQSSESVVFTCRLVELLIDVQYSPSQKVFAVWKYNHQIIRSVSGLEMSGTGLVGLRGSRIDVGGTASALFVSLPQGSRNVAPGKLLKFRCKIWPTEQGVVTSWHAKKSATSQLPVKILTSLLDSAKEH